MRNRLKGGTLVLLLIAALAGFDVLDSSIGITGAYVASQSRLASSQCAMDLSSYPCQFVRNGKFDAIIAASKADSDIVALIGTGLRRNYGIAVPASSISASVTNPLSRKVVSVGNGCINPATYAIQAMAGGVSGKQCFNPAMTKEGQGLITLYDLGNGKAALVVEGYTREDLKNAAKALQGYKDWQAAGLLKGRSVLVQTNSFGSVKVVPRN